MGRRVPPDELIARTTALYLLIFACVLAALDAGAYVFIQREYISFLGPALGTAEGGAGLAAAMRRVLLTILAIDVPLIAVVGLASYALARVTIAPLEAARERERIFAADAAHELRSPLTAIASVAQAARLQSRSAGHHDPALRDTRRYRDEKPTRAVHQVAARGAPGAATGGGAVVGVPVDKRGNVGVGAVKSVFLDTDQRSRHA